MSENILCEYCNKREKVKVAGGKYCCGECVPFNFMGVTIKETEFIQEYGNVSKNRLREMDRRVILPYNKPDGGYYLGRRGENGKIQEREPRHYG